MVCFYHYAQGARVNPPPLGFILNVSDPVHAFKLTLSTTLWGFVMGNFFFSYSRRFVCRLLLPDGD